MTLTLTRQETILGWIWMGIAFLVLPFLLVTIGMFLGVTSEMVLNLALYVCNAIGCGLIFRKLLKKSRDNLKGKQNTLINAAVLGFVGYYAATTVVGILILMIDPDFANVNDQNINSMIAQAPLPMFVAITMLVPLAEECLFRGLIFVPLCRKSVPLAYAITCLSFAAIHIIGYIGHFDAQTLALCFVQYLAPGAALCWACKKADSLFAPIAIHAAINGAAFLFAR